jgi:hypothetical protein
MVRGSIYSRRLASKNSSLRRNKFCGFPHSDWLQISTQRQDLYPTKGQKGYCMAMCLWSHFRRKLSGGGLYSEFVKCCEGNTWSLELDAIIKVQVCLFILSCIAASLKVQAILKSLLSEVCEVIIVKRAQQITPFSSRRIKPSRLSQQALCGIWN